MNSRAGPDTQTERKTGLGNGLFSADIDRIKPDAECWAALKMRFAARQFEFVFPRPTVLMGIVNVTPDSFSDGGKFLDRESAINHALQLASESADILDIGGESTRPGAEPVSIDEETARVVPVIHALAPCVNCPISIDTRKPEVALAAIEAGATIVNDIAACRNDPAMWNLVAKTGAGYVCMHMQGTPQTMQRSPHYTDVVAEVDEFFADRIHRLTRAGVRLEQIVLDVGIGFGKLLEHNLSLLGALSSFQKHGRPLLLGVSHKSFIGRLTKAEAANRLPGSIAATVLAVSDGVQMVRTHDVAATRQALQITEAIRGTKSTCGNN